jgi:hypothetical protein
MSASPVTVGPLAAGEQWRLRAYASLTAGQANSQHVTVLTDMAAAIVDKIVALSAPLGIQTNYPLSAGLVAEANATVANAVLGGDPHSILSAAADPPIAAAALMTTSPVDQREEMEFQAALSVWASPMGSYQFIAGSSYFVPTATCGDPVVCSGTGTESALVLLERAIADEIGAQFAIGNTANSSQFVAFVPSTAQQAVLPAYALQNIALNIETSNSYGVPAAVAAAAAAAAGTPDAVSGLLVSSQFAIEHGLAF